MCRMCSTIRDAKTMRTRGQQSGLTIIELMVAMVAGAIVAVTAGAMLYYGYVAWRQNNAVVDIQRDATVALGAIGRAVRGAVGVAVGAELRATNAAGVVQRFHVGGDGLLYEQPDTLDPAEILLTVTPQVTVAAFSSAAADDGVAVHLDLLGDETRVTNSVVFHTRN